MQSVTGTNTLFAEVPIYSVSVFLTGKNKGKILSLIHDKVPIDQQGCGVIRKRFKDFDYLLVLSTVSQSDAITKAQEAFEDHNSGKHIFKFEQFYAIV